ncbi:MAG TPA: ATPase domain-containing protein [Dehalococcoidia bacterium]|nr:ATPase domain-containing protein [Dehalococcoidia bacterium]
MELDLTQTLGEELKVEEAEAQEEPPEEEEQSPRLIAVGVMDIDKRLGGGLPPNSLTLVEGDPDAGKSVVVQQLAYGALKESFRAALYLSETGTREFLGQMESLGMSITDYYLLGRLASFQANLRVDRERAERLLHKLLHHMERSDSWELFVVDSITSLLFQFDERFVLSFLAQCKDLADTGRTIMVTLHSYAMTESLRLRANSIVDAHLRLRIEDLGKQLVRTLEVVKVRGAVKTADNSVSFSVEPGLGLKSIPISKAKA